MKHEDGKLRWNTKMEHEDETKMEHEDETKMEH